MPTSPDANPHAGRWTLGAKLAAVAQPVPAFTLVDAHLERRLSPKLALLLGVDNLTRVVLADKSPLYGYAERPRTWRLSLRTTW